MVGYIGNSGGELLHTAGLFCGALRQGLGPIGHLLRTCAHLGGGGLQLAQRASHFLLKPLNGRLYVGKIATELNGALIGKIAERELGHAFVDGIDIVGQFLKGKIQLLSQFAKLVAAMIIHMNLQIALGQSFGGGADIAYRFGNSIRSF